MFERIRAWYVTGKWTADQVDAAVVRGWITPEQAQSIFQPPETPAEP